MGWLRRAWTSVVQAMTTTPPEMIRQPKPDLESLYRYKRQRLSRANATGDVDAVKRLTAECRDLKREMENQ